MTKTCLDKILSVLEMTLKELPEPLVEPIWYPGLPKDTKAVRKFLSGLETIIRSVLAVIIEQLKQEGFFDENPVIKVYPNYREATGIIIYYKGEKVFEKWLNSYELNLNDKEEVSRKTSAWYEEMRNNMDPEELENYHDAFPEEFT